MEWHHTNGPRDRNGNIFNKLPTNGSCLCVYRTTKEAPNSFTSPRGRRRVGRLGGRIDSGGDGMTGVAWSLGFICLEDTAPTIGASFFFFIVLFPPKKVMANSFDCYKAKDTPTKHGSWLWLKNEQMKETLHAKGSSFLVTVPSAHLLHSLFMAIACIIRIILQ